MMSTAWRDKQHPNLINFIAAFLAANSYRINFLSLSPVSAPSCPASNKFQMILWCLCKRSDQAGVFQDFIFNNGGLSVAFIFETNWDCRNAAAVFSRCERDSSLICFTAACCYVVVRCDDRNSGFTVGMVSIAG